MTRAQSVISTRLSLAMIRQGNAMPPTALAGSFWWRGKHSSELTHLDWCEIARYSRRLLREQRESDETRANLLLWRERREAQKGVVDRILDRLFG